MKKFSQFLLLLLFFIFTASFADELIIEPEMGRAPILSAINGAKSSVNLIMYGLTDEPLINALIQAQKQGKNVQVLLERHPYKTDMENDFALKQLTAANIKLPLPNPDFKLTHQKTLLIDDRYALIMTFNFTHSTFLHERNFALMITDPILIQEIQAVSRADAEHKNISVNNKNLIWSPNDSRERILDEIHQAKSDIKIYAQTITDYKTIGALAKAAHDGVKIQILMSPGDKDLRGKKFDFLEHAGIAIRSSKHYFIHAKVIMIDHQKAILGSTNLTKPSLDDNRELSILIQDPKIISQLDNTFNTDWNEADKKSHPYKLKIPHLSHMAFKEIKDITRMLLN